MFHNKHYDYYREDHKKHCLRCHHYSLALLVLLTLILLHSLYKFHILLLIVVSLILMFHIPQQVGKPKIHSLFFKFFSSSFTPFLKFINHVMIIISTFKNSTYLLFTFFILIFLFIYDIFDKRKNRLH